MNGDEYIHKRAGGRLFCEGFSLQALAKRHGTPCWVMSAGAIRAAIREVRSAFAEFDPLICYAMKANFSLGVVRIAAAEGCGVEVVSGGELYRATVAGVPAGKIVFSGVGKTDAEIEHALRRGIMMFNVESLPELRAISRIARRTGIGAPVALRVNPHVDAHTHRYITTGTDENKFGIDITVAEAAFREAARLPGIRLRGVHTHIGSQITGPGPFIASLKRINLLLERLDRRGITLPVRNMGGGFGISYRPSQRGLDVAALARAAGPFLRARRMRLILEPGRYLVGEAGVLLTRVIYVKKGVRKTFVIVDAGMNDLIRPCLYEAHHDIVPCSSRRGAMRRVDVVGPICESSDFLALDRRLAPVESGDVLAVLGAGAYGSAMSSNYNGRRRAAEVVVDGRRAKLIRRRESLVDLVRNEVVF
jgi:diaminopimelate decarboxylase